MGALASQTLKTISWKKSWDVTDQVKTQIPTVVRIPRNNPRLLRNRSTATRTSSPLGV